MKTPLTIEIMLACYCSESPQDNWLPEQWNSPAAAEVRSWLQREELIDVNCRATERGKVWVEYIVNAPLPVKKWEFPRQERNPWKVRNHASIDDTRASMAGTNVWPFFQDEPARD